MILNKNLPELIEESILKKEGVFAKNGSLACKTGKFTGRSPEDKFIVCDEFTENVVNWGKINQKISRDNFKILYNDMLNFADSINLYQTYAVAGRLKNYSISLNIKTSYAWHAVFCQNLFIVPNKEESTDFSTGYNIICIPEFDAIPSLHGTKSKNFTVINLTEKIILIGGTGYAGEIKKSVFTVFNYILPIEKNCLSMHCSATVGKKGDTALFFGLSGTGKTTLSADPKRLLIGDDEHGWSEDEKIFNIEGGCYAKVINLSSEDEPDIYNAIKFGSVLENVILDKDREPNYSDPSITENTRVAYSLNSVKNKIEGGIGTFPKNIFFLTCDAFGVFPPVSLLNKNQAIYYFLSGYTAKVAGTELGVKEPVPTFSACFGAAFLPLSPIVYAKFLNDKLSNNNINVWLINTGWIGGRYGYGERISIKYTRAIIDCIVSDDIEQIKYQEDSFLGLKIPIFSDKIPQKILFPEKSWSSIQDYKNEAENLVEMFRKNFSQFEGLIDDEIINSGPKA